LRVKALQRLAHVPRYREITNILVKHGFGFFVDRVSPGIFKKNKNKKPELRSASVARELRAVFEELGPTYVKLGQLLSTRPDLLPPEYIKEFEKLQDNVPPVPAAMIRSICREEGINIEEDFTYFNPEPLAAASIAQVHEAQLKNGQRVAIKIRRPGIDRVIESDLDILMEIAGILERRTDWGNLYRISEVVSELRQAILNELDFHKEARNADIFYQNFKGVEHVVIPKIYWEFSSSKVITMEYLEGIKVSDQAGLKTAGYDSIKIVKNLVDALFKQVFEYGFFHADPHPGNLAVVEGERIIFYDFGQVGVIDQLTRERAMDLLVGMIRYDVDAVMRALLAIGIGTQSINKVDFRREITRLQQKYYGLSLSQIDIGEALSELIELSFAYRIRIPPELSLLVKMMMTVESLVTQLDPLISIVDIAEPYGKKIIQQKYSTKHIKEDLLNLLLDYGGLARTLPRDVRNIVEMIESGELKVKMEHSNLDKLANKIDVLSNRLALAIIIAGIIVGTSLVVETSRSSFISKFPLVETGFLVGILLGLGLIYSIFKSGRY